MRARVVLLSRGDGAAASPPRRVETEPAANAPPPRSAYRLDWAALLKRVFAIDVLACARCDGRMRVLAFVTGPAVPKILRHLRLPEAPLPVERARGPPQGTLEW